MYRIKARSLNYVPSGYCKAGQVIHTEFACCSKHWPRAVALIQAWISSLVLMESVSVSCSRINAVLMQGNIVRQ